MNGPSSAQLRRTTMQEQATGRPIGAVGQYWPQTETSASTDEGTPPSLAIALDLADRRVDFKPHPTENPPEIEACQEVFWKAITNTPRDCSGFGGCREQGLPGRNCL